MKPVPTPAPLSRQQEQRLYRLQQNEDGRENARWWRSTIMSVTGGSHGVLVRSAEILGYGEIDRATYMRIRMQGMEDPPRQWDVLRRYDDFENLRSNLGVLDTRVGCIFPQKQGFWSSFWSAPSEGELGQRMALLQGWMNGLLEEFQKGGDGRNSLIPMNRSNKLVTLHRFFGIQADGKFLKGTAAVEDPSAAVSGEETPKGQVVVTGIPIPDDYMAQPSAPPMQTLQEEDAELKRVLEASKSAKEGEDARLKAEEEAQLQADLEAIRKAEEEEARLKAEEAAKAQAELDAKRKAEEEEAIQKALEEDARIKAEEAAKAKAEQEKLEKQRLEEEAKAEEERLKEEARLEEERKKKEEEERLKAEEEARIKAEKEKSWLQRAVELENKAKGLEAEGKLEEAVQLFNNCVELLKLIIKQEKNPKVAQMVQDRHDQLAKHLDQLWAAVAKAKLEGTASAAPPTATAAPAAAEKASPSAEASKS